MLFVISLILTVAAAMPMRFWTPVGPFTSYSVLDIVFAGATILLMGQFLRRGKLDVGDSRFFRLLILPLFVSALSFIWTEDFVATLKWVLIYVEAIVIYLSCIAVFGKQPYERLVWHAQIFVIVVLIGSVLSLLNVPGFEPSFKVLGEDLQAYIAQNRSYYARLSHPFIGFSNDLGAILAFFVTIFVADWKYRSNRTSQVFALLTLAAIFCTLSRGVFLSLAISGSIFAVSRLSMKLGDLPRLLLLPFLAFGGLYLFTLLNPATMADLTGRFDAENIDIRLGKISFALENIVRNPYLGYGGGTVAGSVTELSGGVHNTYIQQILYYGVFLGLIVDWSLLALPRFFLTRTTRSSATFLVSGAVGYSILTELLVFVGESAYEGSIFRVLLYFLFGLSFCLVRAAEDETLASRLDEDGVNPSLAINTIPK